MRNYYVLKVTTGREHEVVKTLNKIIRINGIEDYVFNPNVPEIEITKSSSSKGKGRKKKIKRKLYPGYILIELDLSDNPEDPNYWKKIVNTIFTAPYVVSFVGVRRTERPIPLKKSEVEAYLSNIGAIKDKEKTIFQIDYDVGEKVKIIDGAFKGFEGEIKEIDGEREKVIIEVDIFGRKTPIELSFYQIEKS